MEQTEEIHDIEWNGILIRITYDPDWMNGSKDGVSMAHLQIKSLKPEYAPLPITETGYLSHFTPPQLIEAAGGPVSGVIEQLDLRAESDDWKNFVEATRQLDLFA